MYKFLIMLTFACSTALASFEYFPNVGDRLVFSTVKEGSDNVPDHESLDYYEISEKFANNYLRRSYMKGFESSFASKRFYSKEELNNYVIKDLDAFCKEKNGVIEPISVPTGDYRSCKVNYPKELTVWHVANLPIKNSVAYREKDIKYVLISNSVSNSPSTPDTGSFSGDFSGVWRGKGNYRRYYGAWKDSFSDSVSDDYYLKMKVEQSELTIVYFYLYAPLYRQVSNMKLEIIGNSLYDKNGNIVGTISNEKVSIDNLFTLHAQKDGFLKITDEHDYGAGDIVVHDGWLNKSVSEN